MTRHIEHFEATWNGIQLSMAPSEGFFVEPR